ncbi:DUF397 domain-containing protein [Actinomadura scrupuli]|uniref:DUF397 domain-containing protein n=1 Tax=Actinomadura scrupuli TaxID=559629 RepID=UPI003D97FAD2
MNTPELTGAVWRKSTRSGANEGSCVEVAAVWRKSTRSGGNEGNCVEVAEAWRKSSHSGADEGSCVEVARAERLVAVRDSKHPDRAVLAFDRDGWRALLTAIKTGAHDRA